MTDIKEQIAAIVTEQCIISNRHGYKPSDDLEQIKNDIISQLDFEDIMRSFYHFHKTLAENGVELTMEEIKKMNLYDFIVNILVPKRISLKGD